MRFAERYRPSTLSQVIGQREARKLQRFAAAPYSTCWLLQGAPGTGKSASALALAADLGAVDCFSGLTVTCAADLGKAEAEAALKRLHQRCLTGQWNVWVIEELERLSQAATVLLKVGLASENLPQRAIVIATSNDPSAIDRALIERFGRPLVFDHYDAFPILAAKRIAELWAEHTDGAPLPSAATRWGWHKDENGKPERYSMRTAMDDLQRAILDFEPIGAAA